MSPIDVLDEFEEEEENNLPLDADDFELTLFLSNFAENLKKEYHFSVRQIAWTIKMYLYERTIDSLLDELDTLEESEVITGLEKEGQINEITKQVAKLEARICVKRCFDQNFRINLTKALVAHQVPEKVQTEILFLMCGFNETQFEDDIDEKADVSIALAPWIDDTQATETGWQTGLSEEFDDIMDTYGGIIIPALTKYLGEDEVEEIFDKSFNQN
ncbi:hypothetical protein [Lactobacillus sp. PV034]|uniref:hypothetical protein n=1 Tax=Lactobacillus sp. PV034 TaxID=2594495 RepID=UPI00223FB357|nr:hypothetical protein [Lactobacillus sp. PV034]QNQ80543.1 hypothetical protein FP432_02755 [Lactobacillus sp. PV034]